MFCPPELAARIDRAEGRFCADLAEIALSGPNGPHIKVAQIAGGHAVFTSQNAPTSKWIGGGFDPVLDLASLDEMERHFASRGARLPAWVSTLADPALHRVLCERGYVPRDFEHVLGHPLTSVPDPPGLQITHVGPADSALLADTMNDAVSTPDDPRADTPDQPPNEHVRRWVTNLLQVGGWRGYLAWVDGAPAGGATLRIDGAIAQFVGAGTIPRFRRRGVQTALLRLRLREAADSGCSVAVIATPPGSKSQQNAQREGFTLLYARQLLEKAPTPPTPRTDGAAQSR
jgi:GNAT superfamily N-acetyltransferase